MPIDLCGCFTDPYLSISDRAHAVHSAQRGSGRPAGWLPASKRLFVFTRDSGMVSFRVYAFID
jgi:hypothetical protein